RDDFVPGRELVLAWGVLLIVVRRRERPARARGIPTRYRADSSLRHQRALARQVGGPLHAWHRGVDERAQRRNPALQAAQRLGTVLGQNDRPLLIRLPGAHRSLDKCRGSSTTSTTSPRDTPRVARRCSGSRWAGSGSHERARARRRTKLPATVSSCTQTIG